MRDLEIVVVSVASVAAGVLVDDWIASAAVVALWAGVRLLLDDEDDGVPVLVAAYSFQWLQVTVGLFYFGLTGRQSPVVDGSDYRSMVLVGLGSIVALAAGLRAGMALIRRAGPEGRGHDARRLGWPVVIACYALMILAEGTALRLQGEFPSLRQIVVSLMVVRTALLFLILRRCSGPSPRWAAFAAVMALEVALGFTGFFAGFREPLVFGALALVARARVERRVHWGGLVAIGAAMVAAGTLWVGIRSEFRRELVMLEAQSPAPLNRLGRVATLGAEFVAGDTEELLRGVDIFVERMWAIYYPALAFSRVPAVIPHTGGAFTVGAISHVLMPRAFFPEKEELQNDSEQVRRYSGVWVAGPESGTTIAFGYVIEAYIDYGLPFMFVPIAAFGLFMGLAYAGLLRTIRHQDIRVPLTTVVFWVSLYPFERSFVILVGTAVGLLAYLAVPAVIFDRWTPAADVPADSMADTHGIKPGAPVLER